MLGFLFLAPYARTTCYEEAFCLKAKPASLLRDLDLVTFNIKDKLSDGTSKVNVRMICDGLEATD